MDVALAERPRGDGDEDQAADRTGAGMERDADDRAHRAGRLDERRHVAVLRGAIDQVRTPVDESVERDVPARRGTAADGTELPAPLVRQPHLGGEAQEILAGIEEAERARRGATLRHDRAQRRLEHVLRRHACCDLAESLSKASALGGDSQLHSHRHGARRRHPPDSATRMPVIRPRG